MQTTTKYVAIAANVVLNKEQVFFTTDIHPLVIFSKAFLTTICSNLRQAFMLLGQATF